MTQLNMFERQKSRFSFFISCIIALMNVSSFVVYSCDSNVAIRETYQKHKTEQKLTMSVRVHALPDIWHVSKSRGQKLSRVAAFSSRSGNTRVAGVTPFWVYIIIHQYGVRPTRGRATKKTLVLGFYGGEGRYGGDADE